jgi:hypothetical protein
MENPHLTTLLGWYRALEISSRKLSVVWIPIFDFLSSAGDDQPSRQSDNPEIKLDPRCIACNENF